MAVIKSEKVYERKTCEAVVKSGGLAVKLLSVGLNGLPDRLMLFMGGRAVFVEFKSYKKKPTLLQRKVHGLLSALGFRIYNINSEETMQEFLMAEL